MSLLNKFKNMPQAVKASVAFFFASIITKGIAYITTPLYTRLLTDAEYGQVSVYLTWVQIFGTIAMFCLSYGVFNNGMVDYPEKRDDYSFSMLILSNIITLAFTAILLCVYPLIREVVGVDYPLVILMCVSFLFQPAYNFWNARQRYELKYKYTVIWSIVSAILSPLVAVLCILFCDDNRLYARLFGAEITLIVIYMAFYVYLFFKNKGKLNVGYWKDAILFNLPLIPHYLSTYLLSSLDKIMISNLIGDEATAYYSVAHSVAAVVLVVWTAINSSLIPYTYEKCKTDNYAAISKVTMPILTAFAVICGMLIMMAPEVVAVMAPASYNEAIYAIPPIVGGVFFQVHYYIYANIVYYYKRPRYVMVASISATVLKIVLNYFCIKYWGYLAAGYTTLICYLVQAVIDYFAMRKVVGQKVYNMRFIGGLSLAFTVVALVSNFIYDYIWLRYAILVGLMLLCVIFRKKIINLIKEMKKKDEA